VFREASLKNAGTECCRLHFRQPSNGWKDRYKLLTACGMESWYRYAVMQKGATRKNVVFFGIAA
jgi:hypothetical protein